MKHLLLSLALTASVFGQPIKSPGINGENIVNPAFRNAVLPSQASQSGKYLKTNGTAASWETVTAAPSGTGFAKVTSGVWDTPSATIPHTDITGLGTAATAALLDSDTMTGASASNVPSAESVVAYVAANAGGSSSYIDVTAAPYSAVGDAKINDGAAMASGTATLTCAAGQFQAGDVGKYIRVVGAGTAGADLVTTISARASTTSVTLAANAATTVSSAQLVCGTDNTTAIQAAINAANASTSTRRVFLPAGKYICNLTSYPNVDIVGAGAPNQQIAFGAINLAANTLNTFLIPAVTTSPIIYLATIYGASVQDICFVGGDGTVLADRKGTGIQLGVITAGATGATGGSFAARRCEFSGLERGIHAASMWDSVFEMLAFNYCDRGFLGGEVPLEAVGAGGPADGLTFLSCQSNFTDIVFEFDRCKQTSIIGGDFNSMVSFVKSYNSATIVSGVNIESATNCIFHLAGVNPSRLDVGYLETQSTTDVVWNECTATNPPISIRSAAAGMNYKTAAASGYPRALPIESIILRYTSAAFTTLKRTEKWDWIARTNWERENNFRLYEPFIKSAASPYGSLGWTGTAISTYTTGQFGNQSNAFYIYLSANTKAVRFAPEYANSQFFTNWRMSWIFKNSLQVGSMALRMGLYTYDATPVMIPANGIGLRADTVTAGDTNIQLEVIVGGAIQTVVDTGIAISTLDDAFFEMVLEKQGSSVYLMLINQTSGAIVANQVVYSGTMPSNSPTYCAPMVFLATSHASGSQLDMRRMSFEEMK